MTNLHNDKSPQEKRTILRRENFWINKLMTLTPNGLNRETNNVYKYIFIGVIYMVILNLSRHIRFKPKNNIIVGIIPGPKEPELAINSFLEPLVVDLLIFWKGVYLDENGMSTLYRFILLGSSSDLPATRKCCGFMSFNALQGIHTMFFLFKFCNITHKPSGFLFI